MPDKNQDVKPTEQEVTEKMISDSIREIAGLFNKRCHEIREKAQKKGEEIGEKKAQEIWWRNGVQSAIDRVWRLMGRDHPDELLFLGVTQELSRLKSKGGSE